MGGHAALQPGPGFGSVYRLRSSHRHLQDPAVSQQDWMCSPVSRHIVLMHTNVINLLNRVPEQR